MAKCRWCVATAAARAAVDEMMEAVKGDPECYPEEDFKCLGRLESAQVLLSNLDSYCTCTMREPEKH